MRRGTYTEALATLPEAWFVRRLEYELEPNRNLSRGSDKTSARDGHARSAWYRTGMDWSLRPGTGVEVQDDILDRWLLNGQVHDVVRRRYGCDDRCC